MFNIHSVHKDYVITVEKGPQKLTSTLDHEIQAIWETEQARCGKALFNDLFFSVHEFSESRIVGQFFEYRLLIAQLVKPELFETLRIRPLAGSGFLRCSSGIVFGQRNNSMTQDPGLWELVPSGGVNASCETEKKHIDINQQLLRELNEEIGIKASLISNISPFCLVEDTESYVIDIGIEMTTTLDADSIQQSHYLCNNTEYKNLKIIPIQDIPNFLSQEKGNIVEVSRILIGERGFSEALN